MSRLARCNRCGAEREILTPEKNQNTAAHLVAALNKMNGWRTLSVTDWGLFKASQTYDLCDDCHEILVEQFFKGAAIAPITQPLDQIVLPHQPMTDCMLVWDPERGGFLCEHDDPERYHKLCRDQAQNVAEGVPPQRVRACTSACSERHTYEEGCQLGGEVPPASEANNAPDRDPNWGVPHQRGFSGDPESF